MAKTLCCFHMWACIELWSHLKAVSSKPRHILRSAGLNCKEMSVWDVCVCMCVCPCIQPVWAKGNLHLLCCSCLTLWTLHNHPTRLSVTPSLYIPAWMCSFWLVSLRYDIPFWCQYVCAGCPCVCGGAGLARSEYAHGSLGTVPSTRCVVGCVNWHRQGSARTLNSLPYPQLPSAQAHKHCPMSTTMRTHHKPGQNNSCRAMMWYWHTSNDHKTSSMPNEEYAHEL